jgi:hypothetical protein
VVPLLSMQYLDIIAVLLISRVHAAEQLARFILFA